MDAVVEAIQVPTMPEEATVEVEEEPTTVGAGLDLPDLKPKGDVKRQPFSRACANGDVKRINKIVSAVVNTSAKLVLAAEKKSSRQEDRINRRIALLTENSIRELILEQDTQGHRPLHIAAVSGCLSALLEARPRIKPHFPPKTYFCCECAATLTSSPPKCDVCAKSHVITLKDLASDRRGDVNCRDKQNNTPLHYAAFIGDVAGVRALLASGANSQVTNCLGKTPAQVSSSRICRRMLSSLTIAAVSAAHKCRKLMKGKAPPSPERRSQTIRVSCDELKEFIGSGEDVNMPCSASMETALHKAAALGSLEVVEYLLSIGAEATVADANGWTPLHHAVNSKPEEGHFEVVKALVKNNPKVVSRFSNTGRTALAVAVQQPWLPDGAPGADEKFSHDIVEFLCSQTADLDVTDDHGDYYMHLAAAKGRAAIINVLLCSMENGLLLRNDRGRTALHCACVAGHVEVIHLLSRRDADVRKLRELKDNSGCRAFDLTSKSCVRDALTTLWDCARSGDMEGLRRRLSAKGEGIGQVWGPVQPTSASIDSGRTALHFVVVGCAEAKAEAMAEWRKSKSKSAIDLFQRECRKRCLMMQLLVEAGAKVDAADNRAQTALHIACRAGLNLLLKELLDVHKADIHAPDLWGNTPVHLAVAFSQTKALKMLEARGANSEAKNNKSLLPADCAGMKAKVFQE